MAPMAHFPFKDPGRHLTAPNNPRGTKAAQALNALWQDANKHREGPQALYVRAQDIDFAAAYRNNGLLCGTRRLMDGPFYHIWPDQSAIVGYTEDGATAILPVALRLSNALAKTMPLPFTEILPTTYQSLDGLDFWVSQLKGKPKLDMTPESPYPASWASLRWAQEDTIKTISTLAREMIAWYMVFSGHHPENSIAEINWAGLNRNGTFSPLSFKYAYSDTGRGQPNPGLLHAAQLAAQTWVKRNPDLPAQSLVIQKAAEKRAQRLNVIIKWTQDSSHDRLMKAQRFRDKTGL